jgi:hypothetical protein
MARTDRRKRRSSPRCAMCELTRNMRCRWCPLTGHGCMSLDWPTEIAGPATYRDGRWSGQTRPNPHEMFVSLQTGNRSGGVKETLGKWPFLEVARSFPRLRIALRVGGAGLSALSSPR